jgi:hypothetical protein
VVERSGGGSGGAAVSPSCSSAMVACTDSDVGEFRFVIFCERTTLLFSGDRRRSVDAEGSAIVVAAEGHRRGGVQGR